MCDQNIQIYDWLQNLRVKNSPGRDKISDKSSSPFSLCLPPLPLPSFLFYSPLSWQSGVLFISLGMWSDLVCDLVLQPALSVKARTGRSLSRDYSEKIRSDLGKINLIYCQTKQIWMVRNRDKIKNLTCLCSPPLLLKLNFSPSFQTPLPTPAPARDSSRLSALRVVPVSTPAFHCAFPHPSPHCQAVFPFPNAFPQRCCPCAGTAAELARTPQYLGSALF